MDNETGEIKTGSVIDRESVCDTQVNANSECFLRLDVVVSNSTAYTLLTIQVGVGLLILSLVIHMCRVVCFPHIAVFI